MIVDWSERARIELAAQLEFISQDKPSAADRMAELVQSATSLLATWPEMGKPGRVPSLRELVIAKTPFLVVYRMSNNRVEIIRLLHGSQNYTR